MNTKFVRGLCLSLFALVLLSAPRITLGSDVILEWNRVVSDTIKSNLDYQNPGMASRTMAMTNIAMYDALNTVMPQRQTFYSHGTAPTNAMAEAAVLQAGYRVLSSIYPGEQTLIDNGYNTILSTLPSGAVRDAGIHFGNTVGQNVIQHRSSDGYMNMVSYSPTDTMGHWQPDPLNPQQEVWGPEWGHMQTFAVGESATMMPPAMPDLTSQQYTSAFNEVKELGAVNSTMRTADQTEAGLFWAYDRVGLGTPMRMYMNVLETVATEQNNDMHENAHLFALASISLADAGIVAWDAKFEYDFWRPISGIRHADLDGNPDTTADPNWVPLGSPGGMHPDGSTMINDFTPPFPTYISGHASFGGALFHSLESFYGTDDIAFSLTSEELPGTVRDFESFGEAMRENGRSRVYLGIHWDFDDLMARNVGAEVAEYVATNHFEPVPEPPTGQLFLLATLSVGLLRRRR